MSLNLFNYRGIFWIYIYSLYIIVVKGIRFVKYIYMYINCISLINNGDDVIR